MVEERNDVMTNGPVCRESLPCTMMRRAGTRLHLLPTLLGTIGCQIGCQRLKNEEAVNGKNAVYRFLVWWAGRAPSPRSDVPYTLLQPRRIAA